jgi:hypothetical protein
LKLVDLEGIRTSSLYVSISLLVLLHILNYPKAVLLHLPPLTHDIAGHETVNARTKGTNLRVLHVSFIPSSVLISNNNGGTETKGNTYSPAVLPTFATWVPQSALALAPTGSFGPVLANLDTEVENVRIDA